MSDLAGRRIDASAFRARRFPALLRQQLRVRNGPPLPAACLPTPPLATDSAAAPHAPLRSPSPPSPPPTSPRQPALESNEAKDEVRVAPHPPAAVWRRTKPPEPSAPSTPATQIGRGIGPSTPTGKNRGKGPSVRASTLVLGLAAGLTVSLGMALWLAQIEQLAIASRPAAIATNNTHDASANGMHGGNLADTPAVGVPPTAPEPVPPAPHSTPITQPPVATIDVRERPQAAAAKPRSPAAAKHKSSGGTARRIARAAPRATTRATAAVPEAIRGELRAKRRGARSDEIGRLKSQAYSESSRDRLRRSPPPARSVPRPGDGAIKPVSAAGKTPASSTRMEFKRCEKIAGLFQREKCKWAVCGARWDNDGCPSFASSEKGF